MVLNIFSLNLFIFIAIILVNSSYCLRPSLLTHNSSKPNGFAPALATWDADTSHQSGAACGWGDDVKNPPFSSMVSAGNANLFLNGKGCGNCFQLLCTQAPFCSGKPITVTISDQCPGTCNRVPLFFDLDGFAFGAMANPGQEQNLRQLGQVNIQYQRVPCNYGATKLAFITATKCNPNWFATAVEYANGDGGIASMEIAPAGSQQFIPMVNIWGAVWKADINPSFVAPFSFRLKSPDGKMVVAQNVIPANFVPGQKYVSQVNF